MKFLTANSGKSRFAGGKGVSILDLSSGKRLKDSAKDMSSALTSGITGKKQPLHYVIVESQSAADLRNIKGHGPYVILEVAKSNEQKKR